MSDSRENVQPTPCPKCAYKLDAATSLATIDASEMRRLDDARPKPDDVTVCVRCGTILVFTDAGEGRVSVREFTPEDEAAFDPGAFPVLLELRARIVAELRAKTEKN